MYPELSDVILETKSIAGKERDQSKKEVSCCVVSQYHSRGDYSTKISIILSLYFLFLVRGTY